MVSPRNLARPPRARPDPAEVAQLLARIQRRHGRDVHQLRQGIFRAEPISRQNLPPTLEANSLTDRHTRITLSADMADVPSDLPGWPPHHAIVTVSIAGHHRTLARQRLLVDPAEEEAWVRAALGPAWSPHAYAAGCMTRVTNSPGAWHYNLILDENRQPTAWPPGDPWPVELRQLDPDTEQP